MTTAVITRDLVVVQTRALKLTAMLNSMSRSPCPA